jgi:small GTP-binding protein
LGAYDVGGRADAVPRPDHHAHGGTVEEDIVANVSKKVCLLGEFAVGKTSLVRRFVYDAFDDKYISTIGVKVSRKTVVVPHEDEPIDLNMMLWDLAGSEEFNRVRASYFRGAAGAVLVCDLTRTETLDRLRTYAQDLTRVCPKAHFVIAGNKCDLVDDLQLTLEDLERAAAAIEAETGCGSVPCYLSSALTGQDVETLFRSLAEMVTG